MKTDYRKYLEKFDSKQLYMAMELIFTKTFPEMMKNCKDEKEGAELFISFSNLAKEKRSSKTPVNFKAFRFYQNYPEFCNMLFGILDGCQVNDANAAYEMIDNETNNIITELIIEGLEKGTIKQSDLEVDSKETKTDDEKNTELAIEKLTLFLKYSCIKKEQEILAEINRILEMLAFVNHTLDKDNYILPVLEDEDKTHTTLDTIYSYLLAIQYEVGKLVEHM